MLQYKHVLMPFVGPAMLTPGLDTALTLVRGREAHLRLLRIQPGVDESASAAEPLYAELKGLQAQMQQGEVVAEIDLEPESSAEAIIAYACEHQIDLIVLPNPSHLSQRLSQLVQDVIAQSCCPVLVMAR